MRHSIGNLAPVVAVPSRARRLAALAAGLTLTSCVAPSCSPAPTVPAPKLCANPARSISQEFPKDPLATADRTSWKKGIEAKTVAGDLPAGATGIIVSFHGHDSSDWHDSKPVDPTEARTVALKIGDQAVTFSTLYAAPDGSRACNMSPPTIYDSSMSDFGAMVAAGATTPQR